MPSTKSGDGVFRFDAFATATLRASSASTVTTRVNEAAVAGFGGLDELEVFVDITAVSFTGGAAPTAQLKVWLQRTPDGGTTWDDALALQSAALAAGATEKDLGYASARVGTPVAPAAVQDGGGAGAFAQRWGAWSDKLRVAHQITVTGGPTTQSVTFSIVARGR